MSNVKIFCSGGPQYTGNKVRRCAKSLIVLISFLLSVSYPGILLAVPDSAQVLNLLQVPAGDISRFEKGDIISYRIDEMFDKELAVGIVMLLKVPLERVVAYVKEESLISLDGDTMVRSEIAPSRAGSQAFDELQFGRREQDEVDSLLRLRPGNQFNFSESEIESFRRVSENVRNDSPVIRAAEVSRVYRELLYRRWQAYRMNGLRGIATYLRNGVVADPASELRLATNQSKLLARYFPELQVALLQYPNNMPPEAMETFLWINRQVEGRPTPILMHRLAAVYDQGAVVVSREYFVAHSYNSSQLLLGCLKHRDGTMVFYVQRTYTDQVTGLGRTLRRHIGRESLKKTMINRFRRLRDRFAG